uniref:DNA-directed RNA polymerase III subunit n=1 Tax=Eptatretus burgeri TaxID=7764 RepID=A0A8C4NHH7_EPTBU
MAGMGRGRGRGQMTFNIEAIGFGKGDALPPTALQPPPLFPPRENLPLPLQTGEETDYQVALKQEFRLAMKSLPYFLKIETKKKGVVCLFIFLNLFLTFLFVCLFIPQSLEKMEGEGEQNEENSGKKGEEQEDEEEDKEGEDIEEEYEEELEEETDYIMSYFDNGEDYAAESDDNIDEAVY